MTVRRVLLWGFMASGKSAVGARAARLLGWRHIDLDREIVRRTGKPIARIFQDEGEAAFRTLERAVADEHLRTCSAVLSPGGGWVTQREVLDQLPDGTLTIWLKVDADTVLERVHAERGGPERPLLSSPDPAARVRALLAEREPLYARAMHTILTDGRRLDDIAAEVAGLTRTLLIASEEGNPDTDGK